MEHNSEGKQKSSFEEGIIVKQKPKYSYTHKDLLSSHILPEKLKGETSPQRSVFSTGSRTFQLRIEEFDIEKDKQFLTCHLEPYFIELYSDLLVRSRHKEQLDIVSFTEYTKLPGIINERLRHMFLKTNTDKLQGNKNKIQTISKESFLENMKLIFIGDLNSKMKFTFEM